MQTSTQNPFKFLDAYDKEDKDLYFGRDSEIDTLYELLSQTDLVLLYGETGTGKTSLVNCGLAKRYDDTDWLPIYIRRNNDINQSILESIQQQLHKPPQALSTLPSLIQTLYWDQLRPIYLIFDQLEELFIIGTKEEQRLFIQHVQSLLDFDVDTKIIFVFREEYLAHLNHFESAIPSLFDKRLRIEAMRKTKAIEVITRTCEVADIPLASAQVPSSILEVITEEGRASVNLPYLQVFLDKMFKKAAERDPHDIVFNEALIKDIGNLGNVLTRFLEDQVAAVEDKLGEKSSVWLFLKFFVTPDGTKKPVYRNEVYKKLGKLIYKQEKIDFCLNYFTNSHILRPLEQGQYELTHDSIAAKIHRARLAERNLVPLIEGNPYKGLTAYNSEDNNIFFGRDKVVREVYNKMVNQPLIVITGASGAGKSSLVKAGLLPMLREEGYQSTPMFRPGNRPMGRIEEVLDTIRKDDVRGKGFVILIDQYEELLTRTEQEEEREAFVQILRELIENPQSLIPDLGDKKVKLLITVRADFEPQFERLGLKEYWYDAKYVIPLLSPSELREIVEKPAYLAATYFEPEELVDRMVDEVLGGAGSLPLLSFALNLLYERCKDHGRIITEEAYKEIGGVIGSLKTHADEIYHGLDIAHQKTMQSIMLRLVSLEGAEVASRRAYLEELVFEDPVENERVKKVLDNLTHNRLIVLGNFNSGKGDHPYVEPAHDALVWGWGTLWDWIKVFGKDNLFLQDRLREGIRQYNDSEHDKHLLWNHHPRLDQASQELSLNKEEKQFIKKSQLIAKKRRRALTISVTSVFLVISGLAIFSFSEKNKADAARVEAESLQMEALNQRVLADSAKEFALLQKDTANFERENALAQKYSADVARKEAEEARYEALLQKDSAEFARENALAQKTSAELARKRAEQFGQDAEKARHEALNQKAAADSALINLQIATDRITATLFKEAEGEIYTLQYDSALVKYREVNQLGLLPSKVARGLMEIAFFYGQSGRVDSAQKIAKDANDLLGIATPRLETHDDFREALLRIDPVWGDSIYHRYFPRMVKVEGGPFTFQEGQKLEKDTSIHSFYIGKTEISNWQYYLYLSSISAQNAEKPTSWINGDNPIIYINLDDANAYASWLSRKKNQTYRVPTEIEWEYAAQGGNKSKNFTYSGSNDLNSVAWHSKNSKNRAQPAGGKQPNELGIYDMSGNAWEWCLPNDKEKIFVVRGGSWSFAGDYCELWIRRRENRDREAIDLGFRISRSN